MIVGRNVWTLERNPCHRARARARRPVRLRPGRVDFGCVLDVIKIEHLARPMLLRACDMGPMLDESSAWWSVTGRGKVSFSGSI